MQIRPDYLLQKQVEPSQSVSPPIKQQFIKVRQKIERIVQFYDENCKTMEDVQKCVWSFFCITFASFDASLHCCLHLDCVWQFHCSVLYFTCLCGFFFAFDVDRCTKYLLATYQTWKQLTAALRSRSSSSRNSGVGAVAGGGGGVAPSVAGQALTPQQIAQIKVNTKRFLAELQRL